MTQRDPDRMQKKILAAAAKEFARHGLAGARVDSIASRAKASKRMIYYYFASKDGLFRTVLAEKLAARTHAAVGSHEGMIDHLIAAQRVTLQDLDYVRLLQWEALESPHRRAPVDPERTAVYTDLVDAVRNDQQRGSLPANLDPHRLALSLLAVALFPFAFPQLTRMFTSQEPTEPGWIDTQDDFLRAFAAELRE